MINKFTQAYEYISQSAIPILPLEVAVVEIAGGGGEASASKPAARKPDKQKPVKPNDDQWLALMAAVKPLNHSVEALLRSCRLGKVTARTLTIQAFYDFHKEKLENPKSKTVLEAAIKQVFGRPLKLKVELTKNK